MELTPVMERYVVHWGEMGARWGVNRSVAQIHALLYLSPQPLAAEEIADTLSIARSNVSNSLRELQSWRIIKLVHVLDDKRDHFESMKNVWEMFRIVLDERKRREIDPTMLLLEECISEVTKEKDTDKNTEERLRELHRFFQTTTGWYTQVAKLPTPALAKFLNAGDKILKSIGIGT